MSKSPLVFLVAIYLCSFAPAISNAGQCDLNIGVTLHPYYSWAKNIVRDTGTITPVIPEGSDPHTYQPKPDDLANLRNLDVLIVNNLGHDEFFKPMLNAADLKDMTVIDTSKGLPLIPSYGHKSPIKGKESKVSYNSHTYISITGSIQQMQLVARELGKLCPENGRLYKKNTRSYAKSLRLMLSDTLAKIDELDTNKLRIATVHDGYAYMFQELGIEVSAVVQPRHGIEPSARQLQDTIKRIKRANINILFTEIDYKKKYVDIIFEETGCRIFSLSHISNALYSADIFTQSMQNNFNDIIQALTEATRAIKNDTTK